MRLSNHTHSLRRRKAFWHEAPLGETRRGVDSRRRRGMSENSNFMLPRHSPFRRQHPVVEKLAARTIWRLAWARTNEHTRLAGNREINRQAARLRLGSRAIPSLKLR